MWRPKFIIPLVKVEIEEYVKPKSAQKKETVADDSDDFLEKRLAQAQKETQEASVTPTATKDEKDVVDIGTMDGKEFAKVTDKIQKDLEDVSDGGPETANEAEEIDNTMYHGPEPTEDDEKKPMSMEEGKGICSAFGEYNDTDNDCKACETNPKYKLLVSDCKVYTEKEE